jgi:hypothetical protein
MTRDDGLEWKARRGGRRVCFFASNVVIETVAILDLMTYPLGIEPETQASLENPYVVSCRVETSEGRKILTKRTRRLDAAVAFAKRHVVESKNGKSRAVP